MKYGKILLLVIIFGMQIFATGCRLSAEENIPAHLDKVLKHVQQNFVERFGLKQGGVKLKSVQEVVWDDACLGLPSEELCARGKTPGYIIILEANGQEGVYHTDKYGMFRFME